MNLAIPDKRLVGERFRKGLSTYSGNAFMQRRMASELMERLVSLGRRNYPVIFEIGCGSGLLTRMAAGSLDYGKYLLNDLVEECGALADEMQGGEFVDGDVENLSPLPSGVDLILSNATFQWLEDLPGFIPRLADSLSTGGVLAFTTFGPENAAETAKILGETLRYPSGDAIKSALFKDFDLLYFSERVEKIFFESPLEVLRHLKHTGATGVRKERWTKRDLAGFCAAYEELYRDGRGVSFTYHPIAAIAVHRKRD